MSNAIALSILLSFLSLAPPERTISVEPYYLGGDCPTIAIECSIEAREPGEPVTASAHITGGKADQKLTFRWTVARGTIVEGQGTTSIKIKVDAGSSSPIATLEIEGLDSGCQHAASCSFPIS
jgi:hypothetical protein